MASLEDFRDRIPVMKCKPGCHDCCGPVPWSVEEWKRVVLKKRGETVVCPYAGQDGCRVYEDRPVVCRLFGTVADPRFRCPHGCGPDGKKMLSAEDGRQLLDEYFREFFFDRIDVERIRWSVGKAFRFPTNVNAAKEALKTAVGDLADLLSLVDYYKGRLAMEERRGH